MTVLTGVFLLTTGGITFASAQTSEAKPTYARIGESVGGAQEIPIPHLVIAEVFSGQVLEVKDDRTLLVKRDSAPDHRETVHLFGLETPDGTRARKYLNDNLKNKNVRVEARRRASDGTLDAVVTLVQDIPARSVLQPARSLSLHAEDMARSTNPVVPAPSTPETPLNVTLVRLGLARTDPKIAKIDAPFAQQLADAENGARKDKNGVWSEATSSVSSAELPPKP